MEPFGHVDAVAAPLNAANVDTDQIIPARFLWRKRGDGWRHLLFHDLRFADDGSPRPEFVLNRPEYGEARILVADRNFGCGSSREHAPWALLDFGIRAVVSTEIADIFRSNSLKNGLVPIVVDDDTHRWLLQNPGADVTVDVASATLVLPARRVPFPIDKFSRYCLMNGIDQLGFLLEQDPAIKRYEQAHA